MTVRDMVAFRPSKLTNGMWNNVPVPWDLLCGPRARAQGSQKLNNAPNSAIRQGKRHVGSPVRASAAPHARPTPRPRGHTLERPDRGVGGPRVRT